VPTYSHPASLIKDIFIPCIPIYSLHDVLYKAIYFKYGKDIKGEVMTQNTMLRLMTDLKTL